MRACAADGADSFAEPLLGADDWPLEVAIAMTAKARRRSARAAGWSARRIPLLTIRPGSRLRATICAAARDAIAARDFAALAEVAEHNCFKMHAAALAASPPLLYWNGATVECVHAIRRLRASGVPVFFTIDAGPQVKAVCLAEARPRVEAALRDVPGVLDVLSSRLGPGAELR